MAELKGTILDDTGDAVSGATINLYAKGTTSPSLANAVADSSGEWEIGASGSGSDGAASVAYATRGEFDLKITNGSDIVWLLHRDRYQVDMVQASNATTVVAAGEFTSTADEASTLVTIFEGDRATMADNDEAYNSYKMSDSGGTQEEVARVTWHQYDVNPSADGGFEIEVASAGTLYKVFDAVTATGGAQTVSIGTGLSGTAITLGHSTSEVTVADNLTVTGDLTVSGTTVTVSSADILVQDTLVFEGTSNAHETTLTIVDPTADGTIKLPAMSAGTYFLPVLDAVTTTAITATPAEINLIDGGTARGTDAIGDGDGVLINDDGTMKMTTVQTLAAYLDDEITAMPNLVTVGTIGTGVWQGTAITSSYINASQTGITSVGALDAGSITSGFTSIDVGAGTIDTTGAVSTGNLSPAGDVAVADAKYIKVGGSRMATAEPASNTTGYGVVIGFDSAGSVSAGDAVYINSSGKVAQANAQVGSVTDPCIGIATNAGGSDGDDVYVLTHGIWRMDAETFTAGDPVYVGESAGALTATAPSTDGDYVQRIGIAVSDDCVLVMPSMDVIEHA